MDPGRRDPNQLYSNEEELFNLYGLEYGSAVEKKLLRKNMELRQHMSVHALPTIKMVNINDSLDNISADEL